MTALKSQANPISSISSGLSSSIEALTACCQNIQAEARLQEYRIEQQQQEIRALKEKVEMLELHKATQLGQDKIVGFLVGAIVLSLLSLATSIFFSPSNNSQLSLQSDGAHELISPSA